MKAEHDQQLVLGFLGTHISKKSDVEDVKQHFEFNICMYILHIY